MTRKSVNLTRNMTPELGQSDPFICQVCRKLTTFRVTVDPERSMTPMDPFPGHADPGVFRVYPGTLDIILVYSSSERPTSM